MKHSANHAALSAAVLASGALGLVLRRLLYALALDERNLLSPGHPLEIALWILTALTAGGIVAVCLGRRPSLPLRAPGRWPEAVGHLLMAVGILLTVTQNAPKLPGYLGGLWRLLGILAPVCLVAAGCFRGTGRRTPFLLHLAACLFLMVHMVNQYRAWSAEPQQQDYVFALLGCVGLTLFAYYCTAFDVAMGNSRMYLGTGLASVYLCGVNLARTEYPWLYLGGIVWVLTDLWGAGFLPDSPEPERTAQDDPS